MQLINKPIATALKSWAVRAAAIVGAITVIVKMLTADNAPAWVQVLHPADIKATWDWLLPYITTASVALGRMVQQDSMPS